MGLLRNALLGFFMISFIVDFSSVSFAEEGYNEAQIKLLKSSATALQQSHPALAAELIKYANEQFLWGEEEKGEKAEEVEERVEMITKEDRQSHVKFLEDSAVILQQSNPDLAKDLASLAERKKRKMLEIKLSQ